VRLAHEPDVAEPEVAQPSVNELRGGARGSAAKVTAVDEGDGQAVCGGQVGGPVGKAVEHGAGFLQEPSSCFSQLNPTADAVEKMRAVSGFKRRNGG